MGQVTNMHDHLDVRKRTSTCHPERSGDWGQLECYEWVHPEMVLLLPHWKKCGVFKFLFESTSLAMTGRCGKREVDLTKQPT